MKFSLVARCCCTIAVLWATSARAEGFNILDFAPVGTKVDRTGGQDASAALSAVIAAANVITAAGGPACVYIPSGTYRIVHNPPEFARAGCVKGDGPTQSTLQLDQTFAGDLFTWSEAWLPTTPGPTVVGLRILGSPTAAHQQNALVFYDRNDEVFLDQVEINDLPGRAFYAGVTQHMSEAYLRESHLRSLRFFRDGAPGVPVVEFNSAGMGQPDATNSIRISQMDIYGARGPGFVIRNAGQGVVRGMTVDGLRIEGREQGDAAADLLTIGDPQLSGKIGNIFLTGLDLIDVPGGYAAMRLTAADNTSGPYLITVYGMIGGGAARGQGLRIDAGRSSNFHFSIINTADTNVVVGRGVTQIVVDGSGAEACWTYDMDPTSYNELSRPGLLRLPVVGSPKVSDAPPMLVSPRC